MFGCDDNFEPEHPYYVVTLDHRISSFWLQAQAKKGQKVVVTSEDVRNEYPESYYLGEDFRIDLTDGKAKHIDFADIGTFGNMGLDYFADEDFKTLLTITVNDGVNESKYKIWVVRAERSDSESRLDLDLFYGMTEAEAEELKPANQGTLAWAGAHTSGSRPDPNDSNTVRDYTGRWGSIYEKEDGTLGLWTNDEFLQLSDPIVPVVAHRPESGRGSGRREQRHCDVRQ